MLSSATKTAIELARRWIPQRARFFLQRSVSMTSFKLKYFEELRPLAAVTSSEEGAAESSVRFGIVRNAASYHTEFVAACLEMEVPFRVLDLFKSNWLQEVEDARCDILLVWPDAVLSIWNEMIKDRVSVLVQELGYPSIPGLQEIWFYEDKRKQTYWLAANKIPHPSTRVFYDHAEAKSFCRHCQLPIVFKTSFGAAASGVRILKSRNRLRSAVDRAFARGVTPGGTDRRDKQWGSVILQEYLPDVQEWRLVRIGDSYFGHPKGRRGDFHSGSGVALWDVPETRHLEFLHQVTEVGGFRSMDVDVFETPDGELLVNELQAVFGASVAIDQCRVDGRPGRFVRRGEGQWEFDAGDFARNACANERVRDALARGLQRRPPQQGQGR